MEKAELKRLESWLALIAEELYVARLDREISAIPTDDDQPANREPADQRRQAHVEQISRLRIALNE
jgi:hypothetical protein